MKLLIITGGSRGLGEQICEQAEKENWIVCELSRSGTRDSSTFCDLASGSEGIELACDVISELAADEYEEIRVINNTGTVSPIGPLKTLCDQEIIEGIGTNSTGSVLLLAHILREFETHSCRKIAVQISSGAALNGKAGWAIYCLTKAGMENFIRSIAEEQALEPFPFETAIFDPGVMDTEMQEQIRLSSSDLFPSVQRFIDLKNSGNLRDPRIVATALWNRLGEPVQPAQRISVSELV